MKSKTTSIAGLKTHYLVAGKGKDILFIHGWKCSAKVWETVLKSDLTKDFRFVAPDLPGFGNSDKPKNFAYSVAGLVNFLAKFISALKLKPFAVIGHSFGGILALKVAAQHRAQKLVLVNTPLDSRINWILKTYAEWPLFAQFCELLLKIPKFEYLGFVMRDLIYKPNMKLLSELAAIIKKASPLASQKSITDILKALKTREPYLLADKLNVAYLRGDKDGAMLGSPKLKKAKVLTFKDVGHCPMLEDKARFVSELKKFLCRKH